MISNMVHCICKAYTKYWWGGGKKKMRYMLSLLLVRYICIFILIFILCSVFTLDLFVLSWTWSWPMALVDVIYWDYTHVHMHTCSDQNKGNANRIGSSLSLLMNCNCLICLLDDQRSLTDIDSTCRVWYFSVMEMPLYFQLLSALFSSLSHFCFCLEINKMYYIHIASMPGSFFKFVCIYSFKERRSPFAHRKCSP